MSGSSRAARLALALTPVLPWIGVLPGGSWALPLLAPLTVWQLFGRAIRDERGSRACLLALAWAALLSAGVVLMTEVAPQDAARAIVHGEAYRAETFGWILSGTGSESDPRAFIPMHLAHLGLFLLLAAVSGGYLGLALGALLTGYMSYFVGAFAAASGAPLAGALAAWFPWSLVRVVSFVLIGVLAARPLQLRRRWPFGRREGALAAVAVGGLLIDVALKWLLAPAYGRMLRSWLAAAGSL